jgi:hypothetical protein
MRRLHFLIWQERLRAAVPLLLAAVLIGGIGALVILDSTVIERSSVHGDVASWSRSAKRNRLGNVCDWCDAG